MIIWVFETSVVRSRTTRLKANFSISTVEKKASPKRGIYEVESRKHSIRGTFYPQLPLIRPFIYISIIYYKLTKLIMILFIKMFLKIGSEKQKSCFETFQILFINFNDLRGNISFHEEKKLYNSFDLNLFINELIKNNSAFFCEM